MAITDPESRIARLIGNAESSFARQFYRVLATIRDNVDLDALALLLEQSRFAEAFEIMSRASSQLSVIWSGEYVTAGTTTGEWMSQSLREVVMQFDQTNTRAVNAMRNNGLRLVSNFTEQQRVTTQQALVRGIEQGANPRAQARAFRNSIGLTANQERWVANYERALRELDSSALNRALRDRRYDRTVSRALRTGEPLTEGQISKLVKRYRERALKYRSETIARTEALRSVHEGSEEMYRQAIENGELQADQLVRIWNTAGDERVRDFANGGQTSHRTMHSQERQVGEPFTSGAGNQTMVPGAFGVAVEDINCRCVVSTRILTLDEIPGRVGVTAISNL